VNDTVNSYGNLFTTISPASICIHTCSTVTPLLPSQKPLCQICGFRTENQNASAEFSSSNDTDNVKCGWGSKNSIPLMLQNASCHFICLRPAEVFYVI